jgi:23S rRNA (adenine1618-N6)-methyltransferase
VLHLILRVNQMNSGAMIAESSEYATQIRWFSSLVSKKDNLIQIYKSLHELGITDVKTVEMAQGQKVSRFVAWRF